jgi:alanine dehydrogenase
MIIGIPKEEDYSAIQERRVGLNPIGVHEIISLGAKVYIEKKAGAEAGFSDKAYEDAGAIITYSKEEIYQRADLVIKVKRPEAYELSLCKKGLIILAYHHLAIASQSIIDMMEKLEITAIGYEIIQKKNGALPVLKPMSMIAGRLAPQIAGYLLETGKKGGRGILLGGLPGVPPAEVVILGAGTLGFWAASTFAGLGCSVYLLDSNWEKLEEAEEKIGHLTTMLITQKNLLKVVSFADVLIGAVLEPGKRAPILVTRDMVKTMKEGSVIIDFSIDQGGCVETSRLTPNLDSVYKEEGVIHFAMPNVPSLVARTSSSTLTNALIPYLREIIPNGINKALLLNEELRAGTYMYAGKVTNKALASPTKPFHKIEDLLKGVQI